MSPIPAASLAAATGAERSQRASPVRRFLAPAPTAERGGRRRRPGIEFKQSDEARADLQGT